MCVAVPVWRSDDNLQDSLSSLPPRGKTLPLSLHPPSPQPMKTYFRWRFSLQSSGYLEIMMKARPGWTGPTELQPGALSPSLIAAQICTAEMAQLKVKFLVAHTKI